MFDFYIKLNEFISIGNAETDTKEEIRHKQTFFILALSICTTAFISGIIGLFLSYELPVLVSFSCTVIFSFLVLLFSKTKKLYFIQYPLLLFILIFPFVFIWTLKGTDFLVIWACFTPIFSIFYTKNKSLVWYFLFLFLIFISILIEYYANTITFRLSDTNEKIKNLISFSIGFSIIYFMIRSINFRYENALILNLEKSKRNEEIMIKAFKQLRERENKLTELNSELNSTVDLLHAQKKELERALFELKEAQTHLVHSEKMASIGILTSGVAHELNNPLNFIHTGVLALTAHLEDFFKKELDDLAPFFKIIEEGVNRATSIVKALNQFSRSVEKMDEKVNVHDVIDNCLAMVVTQTRNKVTIEKKFMDGVTICLGNGGKLHQAFLNIITNAIQAIKTKGTIEILTSSENGLIKIKIKDSGVGIAKENLNRISTPFFTTKEIGQGTGLGLSITYKIIAEHNGTIEVDSDERKGTEFTINIPEVTL